MGSFYYKKKKIVDGGDRGCDFCGIWSSRQIFSYTGLVCAIENLSTVFAASKILSPLCSSACLGIYDRKA